MRLSTRLTEPPAIGTVTPNKGRFSPTISKGPAIINSGFAGTVSTTGSSTTVVFSSAADALLAGYSATNPMLGTTLITAGPFTRHIQSWTNNTTCVVDTAVTLAGGTAITSVQLPIAIFVNSAGAVVGYMLASGLVYFVGNFGIGTTGPQSLLHIGGTPGSLATGLTFGDGDSGFYESIDDTIIYSCAGAGRWQFGNNFGGTNTGDPMLRDGVPTATSPGFSFIGDENTGIGQAGADILSLIAGGTNVINITNGNLGFVTTDQFGSGVKVIGIGNCTTAPTTNPTAAIVLYAEAGELKVRDAAGNTTTLSPHSLDAPAWMYDWDIDKQPPNMTPESNNLTGYITWTNHTRQARLLEAQLLGEKLPVDPAKIKFRFIESFDEYELRTGEHLVKIGWEDQEISRTVEAQEKIDAAVLAKAELEAKVIELEAQKLAAAEESKIAEIETKLAEIEKQIADHVLPELYEAKPKPEWLATIEAAADVKPVEEPVEEPVVP